MSRGRVSRRDVVPHSGNNRIRSTSPDRRRLDGENKIVKYRSLRVQNRSLSADRSKPESTDKTCVNGETENYEKCRSSRQGNRLSRRDLNLTDSSDIKRKESTDKISSTPDYEVNTEGKRGDTNPDVTNDRQILEGIPKSVSRDQTIHQHKRQNNKKHIRKGNGKPKRQKGRGKNSVPINPKVHNPVQRQDDGNNNATNPPRGVDVRNGGRSIEGVSLMEQLRNALLCSSNQHVIPTTTSRDDTGARRNELRYMFQLLFSGGKGNTRVERRGVALDFMDKETRERESLLQEYWALQAIWDKNQTVTRNNALNDVTQDRTQATVEDESKSRERKNDQKKQESLSEKGVSKDSIHTHRAKFYEEQARTKKPVSVVSDDDSDGDTKPERKGECLKATDDDRSNNKSKKPVAFFFDFKSDGGNGKTTKIDLEERGRKSRNGGKAFSKQERECGSVKQVKKPFAFVVDMADGNDECAEFEGSGKYGDNNEGLRHKQINKRETDRYEDEEEENGASYRSNGGERREMFEEKTPLKKAVAFVIDLNDGEGEVKEYRKDAPNRMRGRQAKTRSKPFIPNHRVKNEPIDHGAKTYQTSWRDGNSGNAGTRQPTNVEMNGGFANNGCLQEGEKPTFKMILESRLQLQSAYSKHRRDPIKHSASERRWSVKAKYDNIKSKIQTRFPEKGNAVNNYTESMHVFDDRRYPSGSYSGYTHNEERLPDTHNGTRCPKLSYSAPCHDESALFGGHRKNERPSFLEGGFCNLDDRLPVIYEGIECNEWAQFPDGSYAATNDIATKEGPQRMGSVKQKYDDVKCKIRTRFPDRDTVTAGTSQYSETSTEVQRPVQQKYDGIKCKIKTRFPVRQTAPHKEDDVVKQNSETVKSAIMRHSEVTADTADQLVKVKPIKEKYGNVKSRIKTRFPAADRKKTGINTNDLNIVRKPAQPSEVGHVTSHRNSGTMEVLQYPEGKQLATGQVTKRIRKDAYECFAQLRKSASQPLFDLPVTYERPMAKKASKLPLSKGMVKEKGKYRLKPSRFYRNHNGVGATTTCIVNVLNKTTRPSPMRLTPPHPGRDPSIESIRRSGTPANLVHRKSTTPRQVESPVRVAQSKSTGNQGSDKHRLKEKNARLRPLTASPPGSHRELTEQSPGLKLKKLPPIRRTPTPLDSQTPGSQTPDVVHGHAIDSNSPARCRPGSDQGQLSPIRHTLTPPLLTPKHMEVGHSSCGSRATQTSPGLHQNKLPPIIRTPTPPHNSRTNRQTEGRSSAARQSPGSNQKNVTPIKRTPTPSHDSRTSGQNDGRNSTARQSPGLNRRNVTPIKRTPNPSHNDGNSAARTSPRFNQSKLPPIKRTPTPPHDSRTDGQTSGRNSAARQSPILNRGKVTPINLTPTPRTNGHTSGRRSAARQSPVLNQGKVTPIKRTPTPPHVDGNSAARPSSRLNQSKLPPIKCTPTPPHDSRTNGHASGRRSAARQSPILSQGKVTPIKRAPPINSRTDGQTGGRNSAARQSPILNQGKVTQIKRTPTPPHVDGNAAVRTSPGLNQSKLTPIKRTLTPPKRSGQYKNVLTSPVSPGLEEKISIKRLTPSSPRCVSPDISTWSIFLQ